MAIRNTLDDIVNVDIEISTPGSSDESFNNVLLVVEGPVVGKKTTDNIGTKVISVAVSYTHLTLPTNSLV